MKRTVIDDIKHYFKYGNVLVQLIIINILVFVFVNLVRLILFFVVDVASLEDAFMTFVGWLAFPYDLVKLIFRPWTIITHMFLQYGIGHVFWNMVILYYFGRIFQEYLRPQRILAVYVLGGIAGLILAVIFNVTIQLTAGRQMPDMSLGASAAVTAVVFAIASYIPNNHIHLILIGPVRLVYVALIYFFMDLIAITYYSNMGGHVAHIGGALFGYFFILQYRKGRDWSIPFNKWVEWFKLLFKSIKFKKRKRTKMRVSHKRPVSDEKFNHIRKVRQDEIDAILDKISKSGYESLSKDEKEILFKASKDM